MRLGATVGSALRDVAVRTACGLAGSALAGYVAFDVAGDAGVRLGGFRGTILDPGRPAFQCLTVGLVAALILALVRSGKAAACGAVAVAWSALALGQAIGAGVGPRLLLRPMWALAIAAGLFLAALVFDALAREGYRSGKFLITAPLVAGFYVAAAPAALVGASSGSALGREFLMFGLLGLVIGNGSGFGVEAADFFLPQAPRSDAPAAEPGN